MTKTKQEASLQRRILGSLVAVFSEDTPLQRRAYDGDHVDQHQRKAAYCYALLGIAVMLAPIDAHNYYSGHYVLATAGVLVLFLFLSNSYLQSSDRQPLMSLPAVLLVTLGLVMLTLIYSQNFQLYWLYPLLVALPILLKTHLAVWLGILVGLIVTPFVWMRFDTNTAIIVCISIAHTWLISGGLMYALTHQSLQLNELAVTDPLTGALNRRHLQVVAKEALQTWNRDRYPSTLLLIDVDDFSQVNDELGHETGDRILSRVVELLKHRLRHLDQVFRYGGKAFAVLLVETDEVRAIHVAEELRSCVEQAKLVPARALTISMGICDVIQAGTVGHWFNQCDRALFQAKKEGRNRVVIATPGAG
jgi:diguanylate cyclase (GGDEF)-like protein